MSAYDPAKHHRRSIRLKGHDYAGGGVYFVTLCAQGRNPLFGQMRNGACELSNGGRIAEQCWRAIPEHFPEVEAGEFVIMPDHIHGIIFMPHTGAKHLSPEHPPKHPPKPALKPGERPKGTSRTLGSVVRGFKIGVTKWFRENTNTEKIWQRDYYEIIVRDAAAEAQITRYIRLNPWRCVQTLGNGLRGMGNIALWQKEKLGVLCSRNAPDPESIPGAAVYLSGFHSPMEKEVFTRLLAAKRNLIWCPAWGIAAKNLSPEVLSALEENRLLILEMKNPVGDLAAAEQRNRFVIEKADRMWTPHVTPGGMLDRLMKEKEG